MSSYLYEVIYDICLIWSVAMMLPGILYIIHIPLKRIGRAVARILSDCLYETQVRRAKRRMAQTQFHTENIYGTDGYRIRTR